MGLFDAGELWSKSLKLECKPVAIDSQQMQNRGVEIANVDGVVFETSRFLTVLFDDVVAVLVRLAVNHSTSDSAAGHPRCETPGMMMASDTLLP